VCHPIRMWTSGPAVPKELNRRLSAIPDIMEGFMNTRERLKKSSPGPCSFLQSSDELAKAPFLALSDSVLISVMGTYLDSLPGQSFSPVRKPVFEGSRAPFVPDLKRQGAPPHLSI
jgi:hypothetical protein